MSSNQANAIKNMILKSGNPLLPMAIEEAYSALNNLGTQLGCLRGLDKDKVIEHSEHLLSAYPNKMDEIAQTPEFAMALNALLVEAIVHYGSTFFKS